MKYLYFENESGDQFDTALMDGYSVGDRLLEDVMFVCKIEDGKLNVIGVDEDSKPYFSELNEKLWMERAQKYAQDYDMFVVPNERGNSFSNEDCWYVTDEDT